MGCSRQGSSGLVALARVDRAVRTRLGDGMGSRGTEVTWIEWQQKQENNAKGSTEAPSQCQPAFPQSRGGRGNLNLRQNAASRRNRPVPNVEEGNHRLLLLVAKGPCRAFAIGIHSFSSVGAPRHRRCTRSVSPRLVGRPPSGRGCRTHANISRCGSRSAVMRVTWPHRGGVLALGMVLGCPIGLSGLGVPSRKAN